VNDDLKPGVLMTSITPQRAFMLAELVALRLRDSSVSEGSKLAADVIATEIQDLAKSWDVVEAVDRTEDA